MDNFVEIDFGKVKTSEDLHDLLREKLGFPNFYGMNWDAFWDAITGLVSMPKQLRLVNWEYLETILPDDANLMKKCLADLNEQYPDDFCEVKFF